MNDNVNHPSHYTQGGVECIDALEAATIGLHGIEAVCTANAIKYLWRWKQKNGAEDLRKARWYIDRLINKHTPAGTNTNPTDRKIIAVDFDGTLCENCWPAIGEPNWDAIHRLLEEKAKGAKLILWTCREDEMLRDAVSACERWGLYFDAVNENLQEQNEKYGNDCRKIGADEYWDDKAVYVAADKPGKQTDIKWSIYEYISPALLRIGAVAAEGLRKYGTDNWYRVSKRDDIEHAIHHLIIALNMLEGYPVPTEEQGDDHLAHAACRVMMAISQEEKE